MQFVFKTATPILFFITLEKSEASVEIVDYGTNNLHWFFDIFKVLMVINNTQIMCHRYNKW